MAPFWWCGYCGVLVSQTELLPVDLYCSNIFPGSLFVSDLLLIHQVCLYYRFMPFFQLP